MAIIGRTGQADTITEGWRALELFTDRYHAIRLFSEYLNDDPPRKSILFFYGDGGNGKSLLLRFLREHYCKRLRAENWNYVRTMQDEELAAHIKDAENAETVPSAFLDFGMPSRGDERSQEAFSALLTLRRALCVQGLRFTLYDFACVWYLHKTGKLTDERLRSLFPAEETDFISQVVNAISGTSWGALGKAVLNVFGKHLRESYTLYMQRRKLNEAQVEDIQRMDPESELIDRLPCLFAEDLNAAIAIAETPKRLVLFFDTHEAFWGHQRNLSDDLYFQRDEWLRRLLGTLEFSTGIVVVVAGRDRPRWAKASKVKIPQRYLDAQFLGHLSETDAEQYLEHAGVADAAMRLCLAAYTLVEPNQVHPLFLGLCADVVLASSEKGMTLTPEDFRIAPHVTDKAGALIDRLLRYVDVEVGFAVRALSACRAFDREIYFKLGKELNFQATNPAFSTLTGFSFVWRAEQRGEGWYRIHDLLRRLAHQRGDDVTRHADEVLDQYYRERGKAGETTAVAEAIYHANRLNWKRGIDEWVAVFDTALQSSRYGLCGALLKVRSELFVNGAFELGRISRLEGDHFATQARHDEASQEYREAITAYEDALRRAPDDAGIHSNKGLALVRLGDLQSQLSQNEEAVESYRQAINACDEALRNAPNHLDSHNNKGWALLSLGDLEAKLSRHQEAIGNYEQAIASFDESLRRAPDYVDANSNKGNALASLGDLWTELSEFDEAAERYKQAVAACDEALGHSPDDVEARNNKGYTFSSLGDLQSLLSRHREAIESYKQAIATYDEVLQHGPDDVVVQMNKGEALARLGDLQTELSQYTEAGESYKESIAACDEALRHAPDDIDAHNVKGWALSSLGDLRAELSQHDEAIDSYLQAISTYDEVLQRAPDNVAAHNNKADTFAGLGDLRAELSQYKDAVERYSHAIASCDEALRRATEDVDTRVIKGYVLRSLGDLRAKLSQHEDAVRSYTQAIASCDQALRRAPKHVDAHNYKGWALASLGDLQSKLSQDKDAAENYAKAIASYNQALQHAPNYVDVHKNKGNALRSLGELQAKLSQHEPAMDSLQAALVEFSRSLEIAPRNRRIRDLHDRIRVTINEFLGMN
jgi:tetratricopeptide (TPR) repeat protein